MNKQTAAGLAEMYASQHSGVLTEDYYLNKPPMGTVKMTAFAKEFTAAFEWIFSKQNLIRVTHLKNNKETILPRIRIFFS